MQSPANLKLTGNSLPVYDRSARRAISPPPGLGLLPQPTSVRATRSWADIVKPKHLTVSDVIEDVHPPAGKNRATSEDNTDEETTADSLNSSSDGDLSDGENVPVERSSGGKLKPNAASFTFLHADAPVFVPNTISLFEATAETETNIGNTTGVAVEARGRTSLRCTAPLFVPGGMAPIAAPVSVVAPPPGLLPPGPPPGLSTPLSTKAKTFVPLYAPITTGSW